MLDKLTLVTQGRSDPNQNTRQKLVILEPSCGHGQIIQTILNKECSFLGDLLQRYDTITIVAIDLDPRAIDECRRQNDILGGPSSIGSTGKDSHHSRISIVFDCHNFLETRRENYIHDPSSVVVSVGGPPYGTDPASRDLPMKFVRHCMREWKSIVIAFLVPQRLSTKISEEDELVGAYAFQGEELADSTFFFKGETAVTQPSRLHCWYRSSDTS